MTPVAEAFLRLAAWRPREAAVIAFWYVTKRRVRARNLLRDAVGRSPFAYGILAREAEWQAGSSAARAVTVGWAVQPLFSILAIAPGGGGGPWVADAIRSATGQSYDRWELLLVGATALPDGCADARVRIVTPNAGDTALTAAVDQARGDFVVPLGAGVTLSPSALFRFAEALQATPEAGVLYGDEDTIDARRRRSTPWLKPRWNAELILALDYVSRACAIGIGPARTALRDPAYRAGGSAYALMLAATRDETAGVTHVPYVVAHVAAGTAQDDQAERVKTVAARIASEGARAEPGPFGTVTVRWPMPDPPPAVTILVPTRDRVELVRACVDSVLAQTRYPNFRVVVIDNGSVESATAAYFADVARDPRVRVLPCEMPYNFSAINNAAVAQTAGDYLCFLNNDTEVIDGDWLGEMMRYASRPGVGAVGAQLLYPDRSIQHAGVVIGLGNAAGHAHRALPEGERGYFAQAHAAHYASAVTAACMVVEERKFLEVGGFDAEHLQIAYNDVDLCLKLGRAGWRNVYAPQARLLHHETKSRGADLSPAHVARYMRELAVLQERWDTRTFIDPMHHPALDRGSETYRSLL